MKECDLVMKGGVTSGVVYPKAIMKIGRHFRLRSIGGTSAGSMAAALAAAAEYRRQKGDGFVGFEAFDEVDSELADHMEQMLQPSPALAPVFNIALDYIEKGFGKTRLENAKAIRRYYRLLKPYRRDLELGAARNGSLLFGGSLVGAWAGGGLGIAGAGAIAGVVLYAASLAYRIFKRIDAEFKAHDFGMLPGTTQAGHDFPAVIDWLADKIDQIAGNWPNGSAPSKPLTAGDLNGTAGPENPDIVLAAVTTDLTTQRPFQLPLKVPNLHYFIEQEMRAVIPARIVSWMVSQASDSKRQVTINGRVETLYPVPVEKDFPVILTTRLSMSFPGLIQAVPLWRMDEATGAWVKCLFSDGGISSNLPIHMFDAWLPRRPTFAISLETYDEDRDVTSQSSTNSPENRVRFSGEVRNVLAFRPVDITNIFQFIKFMFYSAKDWQDKLQSNLTGFNERVATIHLDEKQGGLNLKMSATEIALLQSYGDYAGERIINDFDFDENRLRRAFSILPVLGENLQAVAQVLEFVPPSENDDEIKSLLRILLEHRSSEFEQTDNWQISTLTEFAKMLSAVGSDEITAALSDGNLPHTDAKLSLTASPELSAPKNSDSSAVS